MTKDALFLIRNRSGENRERLELANQIAFWRNRASETTDPMRLASYRRILKDLHDLAVRFEEANA